MKPLIVETGSAHDRLVRAYMEAIDNGDIEHDEVLPTRAQMVKETGLSVGLIAKVRNTLTARGYIRGVPGRATYAIGPAHREKHLDDMQQAAAS